MLIFDRDAVARALPYAELVGALEEAFGGDSATPARTTHAIDVPGRADGTLLLMPAWQTGRMLGVKIVTVFPDNLQRGLASVQATYLLLQADSGVPLAVLDGTELTLRRTAAASALASRLLSRDAPATLLMVGTGNLAPHMIAAHAAVRPVKRVLVWGRRRNMAERLVAGLERPGLSIAVAGSLEQAVGEADIISCATLSAEPLIQGSWLRPGQHLDLVGAYTAKMREADHAALGRAKLFVDTVDGALAEAGEIVQGIAAGVIERGDILADLAGLVRGEHAGRESAEDITLFKSVGCAIEDLAAAARVLAVHQDKVPG